MEKEKKLYRALVLMFMLCFLGSTFSLAHAELKININTASIEELQELPGIGEKIAKRIVEHRKKSPFKTPEDLKSVKGIGNAKFAKIQKRITTSPNRK